MHRYLLLSGGCNYRLVLRGYALECIVMIKEVGTYRHGCSHPDQALICADRDHVMVKGVNTIEITQN
jgi:hypothetical protein